MRACATQEKLMPLVMELNMLLAQDLEKLKEKNWQKLKELWAGCCPGQQGEPADCNNVDTLQWCLVPCSNLPSAETIENCFLSAFQTESKILLVRLANREPCREGNTGKHNSGLAKLTPYKSLHPSINSSMEAVDIILKPKSDYFPS